MTPPEGLTPDTHAFCGGEQDSARDRSPGPVKLALRKRGMMAVSYFVRMRAIDGQEEAVQNILLSNADRIRAGEAGNLAFAVHRSRDDPREFWLYET